jgi:hypothetical protein
MDQNGEEFVNELPVAALHERVVTLEAELARLQVKQQEAAIEAELRLEAVKLGMIDLDGLKLLDAAKVGIDEQRQVNGVHEAITLLRKSKPWLFGRETSSSQAVAPKADPPRVKHATEMSHDEWRAARSSLIKRG